MATTADMRSGLILKIENSLYTVIEFGQNKTARAAAKVWAKLKGVDNSRTIEITWNSGEVIYPVRVEKKAYQYLYKDDTGYTFMDVVTYEQITVSESMVDAPRFLKDGQEVQVSINGETDLPMSVELPDKIVLLASCQKYVRHRDIWDLRWLKQHGAQMNKDYILAKINDYRVEHYPKKLQNLIDRLEKIIHGKEFMAEMSRFLPDFRTFPKN